jgi:hypothetical protein
MEAREMPPTRGAQRYKKLLAIGWVGAIVGITLTASSLLDTIIDAPFNPPELVRRRSAKYVLVLCGWGIVAWIAHRGTRRNLAPPEWLLAVLVLLIWAALLL